MESGYGSPRADKFPAGLRVLVVDDDPTWVKILEKMLKKCSYEVTTCCLARDALNMLRERKDGFDLVISDVNMPDMDGFKLLEHVGLEMDLPVIMMSVDGETSRVMKGVQHGACDYLLKPIRMKELSNIWQHVLRKKIHDLKDTDYYECMGNFQLIKNKSEDFHDGFLSNGGSLGTLKKRKEVENKNHDDQESGDPLSSKKARVVWSVDLHQKFVDAVNQIGFDKVGPKKILDTMKVPGLTRENVASHLQKFRLYLGRLQKENEVKDSLRGTKPLDFPAGDPPRSFGFQNSFAVDQNNSINDSFGHTRDTIPVDDMGQKVHESELKGMVSFLPARKIKNPLTGDLPDHHHKSSIPPQIDPTHSIKLLDQSFEYRSLESTLPTQQWNEVPMMQFKRPLKQIPKQEPKPFSRLEVNYAAPLFSGPVSEHHFHLNFQHPSPSADMQMPVSENDGSIEFPVDSAINSIPLTADCPIISQEAFKATSTITSTMKKKMVDQHCIDNWTPVQQKIIAGGKALAPSLEENIQFLLQEYGCGENFGFQNCYYNPELIDEPQTDCYGQLGVYWAKLRDSIESTFADQGLFIA